MISSSTNPRMRRWRDERGAALIQVGISLFVLLAFSAFVLDWGVMWLARREAQNAADAGALAGAIARSFDETTDPPAADGIAYQSALRAAQKNEILNEAGGINVTWDCPDYAAGGRCVRVDVHRDGTVGSNPLPVYFAHLFGLDSQKAQATATAWAANGNSTNCLRPFSVVDAWNDIVDPALNPKKFQRWNKVGNNAVELNPKDIYTPPTEGNAGTGYTVEDYLGAQVFLKTGNNPQSVADSVSPGWGLPIQLPDGNGGYDSGAADYKSSIKHCKGVPIAIGDYLPTETGIMQGPTVAGVDNDADSLVNQDPDAEWDDETDSVINSCAPGCASFSPRIVPIALFDLDEYQWRTTANNWTTEWVPGTGPGTGAFSCPIGGRCIRVVNIIGFFVEGMTGGDVYGRILTYPGDFVTGTNVNNSASFLKVIQLIR